MDLDLQDSVSPNSNDSNDSSSSLHIGGAVSSTMDVDNETRKDAHKVDSMGVDDDSDSQSEGMTIDTGQISNNEKVDVHKSGVKENTHVSGNTSKDGDDIELLGESGEKDDESSVEDQHLESPVLEIDIDDQPEASLIIDESSNDKDSSVSVNTPVLDQDGGLEDSQSTQTSIDTTDSSTSQIAQGQNTPTGSKFTKRRSRVVDVEFSPEMLAKHRFPFKHGWKREVVYRNVTNGKQSKCDIYYFTPTGKKLRSMIEIENWIKDKGGSVKIEHFTFARKSMSEPPFETVRGAGQSRRPTPTLNNITEAPTPSPKRNIVKKVVKTSLTDATPSPVQCSAKRVVKKTKEYMNFLQLRSKTKGSGFKSVLSTPLVVLERKIQSAASPAARPFVKKVLPVKESFSKLRAKASVLPSTSNLSNINESVVVASSSSPVPVDSVPSQPKPATHSGPKIKYVPMKPKVNIRVRKPKNRSPEWKPSDESDDDSDERKETSPVRNVEVIKYGVSNQDSADGSNEDELQNVLGTPSRLISSIVNPEPQPPKPPVFINLTDTPTTTCPVSFQVLTERGATPNFVQIASPRISMSKNVNSRVRLLPRNLQSNGGGFIVYSSQGNPINTNVPLPAMQPRPGMPVLQPKPQQVITPQPVPQSAALLPPPPPLASRPNMARTVVGSMHPESLLPPLSRMPAPLVLVPNNPQNPVIIPIHQPPLPQLQHFDVGTTLTPPIPIIQSMDSPRGGTILSSSSLLRSSLLSSSPSPSSTTTETRTSLTSSSESSNTQTTGCIVPEPCDKDLVDKIFNDLPNFLSMGAGNPSRRRRAPIVNNLLNTASSSSQSVSILSYSPSSPTNHLGESKTKNDGGTGNASTSKMSFPNRGEGGESDSCSINSNSDSDDSMLPISFGPTSVQQDDGEDSDSNDQHSQSTKTNKPHSSNVIKKAGATAVESSSESETENDEQVKQSNDGSSNFAVCDRSSQRKSCDISLQRKRFMAFKLVQDTSSAMLKIFSHLPMRDLLSVGRVCKLWYRMSRMNYLWQNVDVKSSFLDHWQSAIKFFVKVGVTHLTIQEIPSFSESSAVDEMVKALSRLTQLKELKFNTVPQQVLTRVMEGMPHLQNVGAENIVDAEPMSTERTKFSWNTFPKEMAMAKAVSAIVDDKMSLKAAATMCSVSESELGHLMNANQPALRKQEADNVILCSMRLARMGFPITLPFIEQRMEEEISKRPQTCRPAPHLVKVSCYKLLEKNKHLLQCMIPYKPTYAMMSKLTSYSLFIQSMYKELKVTSAVNVLAFVMKKFSVLNPAGNRVCNVTALSLLSAENIPIPTMLIFPNVIHYPEKISKLILVGSKDGLPTPNMITHYLRAIYSELKDRPLIIFFDGNENIISDQLISDSIGCSVHFHCVPQDIAHVMFPGNHGGFLNSISNTYKDGMLRMKERNFIDLIVREIESDSKSNSQFHAFANTGIYPVSVKASIDLWRLLKSDPSGFVEMHGGDSSEESDFIAEESSMDESDEPVESNKANNTPSTSKENKNNGRSILPKVGFKEVLRIKLKDKTIEKNKQPPSKIGNSHTPKEASNECDGPIDGSGDLKKSQIPETGRKRMADAKANNKGQGAPKKLKPTPVKTPVKTVSSIASIIETIDEVITQSREEYELKEREMAVKINVDSRSKGSDSKQKVIPVSDKANESDRPSLKMKLSSQGFVSVLNSVGSIGEKGKKSGRGKGKRKSNDSDDEDEFEASEEEEVEEWDAQSEGNGEKENKGEEHGEEEDEEGEEEDEEKEEEDEEEEEEEEEDEGEENEEEEGVEEDNEQSSKEFETEEDDDKENKNHNNNEGKEVVGLRKDKTDENEVTSDVSEQEVEEICSEEEEDEGNREMDTSHNVVETDSEVGTPVKERKKVKKKKKKKDRHHRSSKETKESSSLNESSDQNIKKHKKKKGKRKKKKNKSKDEKSAEEKPSDELSTAIPLLEESESVCEPVVENKMDEVENKMDEDEWKLEFIRRVSKADHDYDTKFNSDSGTEAGPDDSVLEVKMDFEEGKSSGEGNDNNNDNSAECEEVSKASAGSVEGKPEAEGKESEEGDKKEETSDSDSSSSESGSSGSSRSSGSSSSSSGSGCSSNASDDSSAEEEEVEEESGSKNSGAGKDVKSSNSKATAKEEEQDDSEEGSSSEVEEENSTASGSGEEEGEEGEEASNDSDQEEEDDDDDEEEEEDEKCQLCMLSNPPHSKDQVIDWVDCDGNCGRWFHVICIVRSMSKVNRKHYVCPSCRCKR